MPHQRGVTSDSKPGGTPVSPKIVASNQMALDTLPPDGTEVLLDAVRERLNSW